MRKSLSPIASRDCFTQRYLNPRPGGSIPLSPRPLLLELGHCWSQEKPTKVLMGNNLVWKALTCFSFRSWGGGTITELEILYFREVMGLGLNLNHINWDPITSPLPLSIFFFMYGPISYFSIRLLRAWPVDPLMCFHFSLFALDPSKVLWSN